MKYLMRTVRFMFLLAGVTVAASVGAVEVGSVAKSRFDSDWTLNGVQMQDARSKLEASANFGGGGTVPVAINITDTPSVLTGSLLESFDIFFVGFLEDGHANAFSNAELIALNDWIFEQGGVLIVTCDSTSFDAVCDFAGTGLVDGANGPMTEAPGVNHPLFHGPFGEVTSIALTGNVGHFTSPNGTVIGVDASGNPLLTVEEHGAGVVNFLSDIDVISDYGDVSAGTGISSDSDRLLGNLFAWAITRQQKGALENPLNDANASGIGLISGWVCDAEEITITIDAKPAKLAAYGTPRNDTASVCGDSGNGFGFLTNFGLLTPGAHTVTVAADGVVFGVHNFSVARYDGMTFLAGESGEFTLSDWPGPGDSATFVWSEANQNLILKSFTQGP